MPLKGGRVPTFLVRCVLQNRRTPGPKFCASGITGTVTASIAHAARQEGREKVRTKSEPLNSRRNTPASGQTKSAESKSA